MYRHHLLDERTGETHSLLLRASYYGDDAPDLARQAYAQDGARYVRVNGRPYLDGAPFSGTVCHHWGGRYRHVEGLLQDYPDGRPAVHQPGPGGKIIYCQGGERHDPAPGVPALVEHTPTGEIVQFYDRGVRRCREDEQKLLALGVPFARTHHTAGVGLELNAEDLAAMPVSDPNKAQTDAGASVRKQYQRQRMGMAG